MTRKLSLLSTATLLAVAAVFVFGSATAAHAGNHHNKMCKKLECCEEPEPNKVKVTLNHCKLCKPKEVEIEVPHCVEGEPIGHTFRPTKIGLGIYTFTWENGHQVDVHLWANGIAIPND